MVLVLPANVNLSVPPEVVIAPLNHFWRLRHNTVQSLLLDAINIWFTNVIAFALWFWNIDEGGQAKLGLGLRESPDFQFPQYVLPKIVDGEWIPGFIDYVFVSSNGRDAPITSG